MAMHPWQKQFFLNHFFNTIKKILQNFILHAVVTWIGFPQQQNSIYFSFLPFFKFQGKQFYSNSNLNSIPFCLPKKTHNRVIPCSSNVRFTMLSGSLNNVTTFCWIISCRDCSSESQEAWNIGQGQNNQVKPQGQDIIRISQ